MSVVEGFVPATVFGGEARLWKQRVGALTAIPALLLQLGAEPARVLAAAGLEARELECAENTIPYAAFGRLLSESARQSGCDTFGLLGGQSWTFSAMGLVGQLIRHSPTVGAGLQLGVVYHHLNSQGGAIYLLNQGAQAELGYAIYYPGIQGADQIYDGVLAAIVNYMRELCGAAWAPEAVLVAHAPPVDVGPYRRLFRSPVQFNSERSALRFSRKWLNRPVPGADPRMLRDLVKQANELPAPSLIEKLHRSLRVLLLSGIVSGDAIAELLAMHHRTLNRRLKVQGRTFREVLDDVRFESACQLLSATTLTLEDISAALGYAGVSPFTRAFRRLSGTAPGRWRQAARGKRKDAPDRDLKSANEKQTSMAS